jgi:hypothetical protein
LFTGAFAAAGTGTYRFIRLATIATTDEGNDCLVISELEIGRNVMRPL